jgi:hypothetical protein
MKKFIGLLFLVGFLIIPFNQLRAETIANRLKGKILLQVESHGEAYYVHPTSSKAYYMANGEEAYNIMRDLGVGITNKDLERIKTDKAFAKKMGGKIFLQVQARGEAFYINSDGTPYYLKDGAAAYDTMRSLGLGITNKDLEKVPLFQKYTEQTDKNSKDIEDLKKIISDQQSKLDSLKVIEKTVSSSTQQITESTPTPIVEKSITSHCTEDIWSCGDWSSCNSSNIQTRNCSMINDCNETTSIVPINSKSCNYVAPTPTCESFTYSDWSDCLSSGKKIRSVISSSPSNCIGGYSQLEDNCSYNEYSDYNFTYTIEKGPGNTRVHFTNQTMRNIVIKDLSVTFASPVVLDPFTVSIFYRPRPGATNVHVSLEKVSSTLYKLVGTEIPLKKADNYLGGYDQFIEISNAADAGGETDVKSWTIWDNTTGKKVFIGDPM